jgi:quercetin dioxygenase-like cupin family protein
VAITHLPSRAGDTLALLGVVTTIKARHAAYSVIESSGEPGHGLPPHAHDDQDEGIYVLAGEYHLSSGDEHVVLRPGAFASVPRGTVHALTVAGTGPGRCLLIFDPPGAMERFLDEVRASGTTSEHDVHAIARRLGLALLTSPV